MYFCKTIQPTISNHNNLTFNRMKRTITIVALTGLMLAARDVVGGADWVKENADDPDIKKAAEKAKKAFAGNEVLGKTLGVIGLGAIGVQVANTASQLGMDVYGYDPYLSVDAAWHMSRAVHYAETLDDLFEKG